MSKKEKEKIFHFGEFEKFGKCISMTSKQEQQQQQQNLVEVVVNGCG